MSWFGSKIVIDEAVIKLSRKEREILETALRRITVGIKGTEDDIKAHKKFRDAIEDIKDSLEYFSKESYIQKEKDRIVSVDFKALEEAIRVARSRVSALKKIYDEMVEILKVEYELLTETNQLMTKAIQSIEFREKDARLKGFRK